MPRLCVLLAVSLFALAAPLTLAQQPGASPQEAVFEQHCAVCHNNPATRAPGRTTLGAMAPDFIVGALTDGLMDGKTPRSKLQTAAANRRELVRPRRAFLFCFETLAQQRTLEFADDDDVEHVGSSPRWRKRDAQAKRSGRA